MIREEIEELKGLAASMGLYDDKNPCKRAVILGKAIKALEQEPCEDCISRDKAIMQLSHLLSDWNDDWNVAIRKCIETVKIVPSVTPAEKVGHWIIIDDCEKFITKCSECGRIEDSRMISKYPYCHCGARMVEAQERSEKE